MQRSGGGIVRGVANAPIEPLPRGATVLSSRRRSRTSIDQVQFDRLVPLLTAAATDGRPSSENCRDRHQGDRRDVPDPRRPAASPLPAEYGAGTTVVMEEIVRRISKSSHPVTLFVLIPPPSEIWPPSLDENRSLAEELKNEGYSEGTVGAVQTFFLTGVAGPWTAETLAALAPIDTVVQLARAMILRKNYPGVDVLTTRSRLLDDNLVGAADVEIARRVREAIALLCAAQENPALAPDPVLLARAQKLQAFFSQPFFVAEPYTKRPGLYVSRAEALRGCREILDGAHDDLPADAFYSPADRRNPRRPGSGLSTPRPFGIHFEI